ncbi:MAG: DUF2252 family protein [Aestuariibacter sp.]
MRAKIIQQVLQSTDKTPPNKHKPLQKHLKMAANPFRFFRGTANLFYDDVATGVLPLPRTLTNAIPLTSVMGDCHVANFGFLTEEGSHGDNIIFSPNDFDDACIGHSLWDILRFTTSLVLTQGLGVGIAQGIYAAEKFNSVEGLHPTTEQQLSNAIRHFIDAYVSCCDALIQGTLHRDAVVTNFKKSHSLHRFEKKAKQRGTEGKHFLSKSALAKAIEWQEQKKSGPAFKQNPQKFRTLPDNVEADLLETFAPYVNDSIIALTERLGAGTGSVNMQRFYLLVGPQNIQSDQELSLCHIVEVKQQREAAPLQHFASLSPVNRLNPAHLTVNCQRRMQRKPDLVLDEVVWHGKHWLVRSRHHARVGISPEVIALAEDKNNPTMLEYADACGRALALAHARGDRRSTLFEQAIVQHLPAYAEEIQHLSVAYAQQVTEDMTALREMIAYAAT